MAITIKGKGKAISRARRHLRLRKKVAGTAERPRLVISRSNRHMVAQVVDDAAGRTLVSASTLEADLRGLDGDKTAKARRVGELVAERAKDAGIEAEDFDRGGNKSFFRVPRIQGTIPHPVTGEAAAGVVFLRPASPGTGVIAGGPVRAVLECAGIHDVLSKSMGSSNAINIVHATVAALRALEEPEAVAARRGLSLEHVTPAALLRAREAEKTAKAGA